MKRRLCLILEGGGVKCAYQSGVLCVLQKAGYKFSGVGGTSFGCVNGAMYIAGGTKRLDEFWKNFKTSTMFNEPKLDNLMERFYHGDNIFDKETIGFVLDQWKDSSAKYTEVSKMYHDMVKNCVDEEKIRKSKVDFGFVTVSLPKLSKLLLKGAIALLNPLEIIIKGIKNRDEENKFIDAMEMTPLELTKKDIPTGLMADYVCASAAIPAFKPTKIGDTLYTDGGIYDNVPIHVMERMGYKDFICIRADINDVKVKWTNEANVQFIQPLENLGSCAMFTESNVKRLRSLGVDDAIAFVDKEKSKSLIWKIRRRSIIKNRDKII